MKNTFKLLASLTIAGTLLLGACGNDEEEKTKDNKTELKQEKPTTDKGKIEYEINKEIGSKVVKSVDYYDGEYTVTMKAQDNMTKKSELRMLKIDTSNALYGIKKSGVNVNSAVIMLEKGDSVAMSSRWSGETINGLDEDSVYTLPDEMDIEAEQVNINANYQ